MECGLINTGKLTMHNYVSCGDCCYLEWCEEDTSDGWITSNRGFCCTARNCVDNLKQFPFKNTKCHQFKARKVNDEM